jgi:hypothetical protein
MEEKPNYFAVIPANVRYDKDLKDKAKLLYGEIVALSNQYGYCYASNKYFANLYGVTTTTISLLIKNLIDKGYIESEIIYKEGTKEILNRYLKIFKEGYLKNLKHNNTSINNKENNNINIITKERFKKPTLEEVKEYCKQRNSSVDPETFYEYFETGGWIDSKGNKVKNWKQKIITWENNRKPKEKDVPSWFDKEQKEEELSEEERRLFDSLLDV